MAEIVQRTPLAPSTAKSTHQRILHNYPLGYFAFLWTRSFWHLAVGPCRDGGLRSQTLPRTHRSDAFNFPSNSTSAPSVFPGFHFLHFLCLAFLGWGLHCWPFDAESCWHSSNSDDASDIKGLRSLWEGDPEVWPLYSCFHPREHHFPQTNTLQMYVTTPCFWLLRSIFSVFLFLVWRD